MVVAVAAEQQVVCGAAFEAYAASIQALHFGSMPTQVWLEPEGDVCCMGICGRVSR